MSGRDRKVMAVVKANAYGHGMRELASEAVSWGVEYLGVARVDEGIELRRMGIRTPILVFEIAAEHQIASALTEGLDLTVARVEAAKKISEIADTLGTRARIQVKVDTGMGRLGMTDRDAVSFIEKIARLPRIDLTAVYSHFATAEEPDQAYARGQLDRFMKVLEGLERVKVEIPLKHMANSGAIAAIPESHFDLVRPGIMLYGFMPRRGMPAEKRLKPVMRLKSRISFLKTVDAGIYISYGRRYTAPERTQIATVPIGYADGYARNLTNRSTVLIRGKRYPVVGTVCMDHLMVNVGNNNEVNENDDVTLIGTDGNETISAWEIADLLGTIAYEITCAINTRVPRVIER
jgi:alanine racemase